MEVSTAIDDVQHMVSLAVIISLAHDMLANKVFKCFNCKSYLYYFNQCINLQFSRIVLMVQYVPSVMDAAVQGALNEAR